MINLTAYNVAQRFIGTKEVPGATANPVVLAMLQLEDQRIHDDAVPWCSAFVNYIAWLLWLPRSKSLAARSWLGVGVPIKPADARAAFDVVILQRGDGEQPDASVLAAPGHVGWFGGLDNGSVLVLGGNQGDSVSLARFPAAHILGVRRLVSPSGPAGA